jgi:hypothetical protein
LAGNPLALLVSPSIANLTILPQNPNASGEAPLQSDLADRA